MQFEDVKKYKKQVKRLYISAFPRNERAPFSRLMRKAGDGRDNFYAVTDEGDFTGLVYTISTEKFIYVFFLAVVQEKRDKGYGSKILDKIKEMDPDKTIILAIEDTEDKSADNIEERIRRLGFYQRNGFKRLHIKINEVGVVYELLGTEETVTQADFLNLMRAWLGRFLFKAIYRKTQIE